MRHGKFLAVLTALAVSGCATNAPLRDMVGYVPPTSLPAPAKRTLVADKKDVVWAELVGFLDSSSFKIDHVDEDEGLLVARYSGDPEPFVDCGSIVTHQGGTLGQISGSAQTVALSYELDKEPVTLNRSLKLDSRIIIRLVEQSRGTVIKTDTTYVVTKTVDVEDTEGAVRRGSRETVSFEAGGRGEFDKGTACQPNGSLDLAVLESLPNIVGSDEIDRADLPANGGAETAAPPRPSDDTVAAILEETARQPSPPDPVSTEDGRADSTARDIESVDAATVPEATDYDWVLPEQGLPSAALPAPDVPPSTIEAPATEQDVAAVPDEATSQDETSTGTDVPVETAVVVPDEAVTDYTDTDNAIPTDIVDDTTRKLLDSLDCGGEEWHFCDLVELTTPYRKRNIEKLFGLTVNTTESFTSQVVGRDLKLDILFPTFPSYLHIVYARRDGTIDHVMSSSEVWPPDLAHQFAESAQSVPGPAGLAMIVAIATDKPLFEQPSSNTEDAAIYLERLKERLAELEGQQPEGPIAASQLLIFVENADT
ncbi:MAG: hypothetical protein ACR2QJ_09485 [Geminicoccaceae bacterium]